MNERVVSRETEGWFGEHDALWTDPKPTTPEGQHLWRLFMLGKLGTSPSGIRDFGQRICQIEAEAAALPAVETTLDVERLARVYHAQNDSDGFRCDHPAKATAECVLAARQLAREYALLSRENPS